MHNRLPPYVKCCCGCDQTFPIRYAKREVVAWVAAKKGGSLSNPERQHFTGRWIGLPCLRAGRQPQPAQETAEQALARARATLAGHKPPQTSQESLITVPEGGPYG